MPFWADVMKVFTYAFREDPLSLKTGSSRPESVGVTQPDAMPDIRADGSFWGGGRGLLRLRDTNDFIDLSSITNRMSRYKEYDRLRSVSEIDTALTIFADEACLAGSTLIPTPFGSFTIKQLAETKAPDERFLVYAYDFLNQDYTPAWAFHPRKVRTAKTINLLFDNGKKLTLTPDHRVLLRTGQWKEAGSIKAGEKLMPFYKVPPNTHLTKLKTNQFPRIYTQSRGWMHERQFVDEWRLGEHSAKYDENVNKTIRFLSQGLKKQDVAQLIGSGWTSLETALTKEGFSVKEIEYLNKRFGGRDRKVIGITAGTEIDVYDMSVDEHHNFATEHCIVHNCQSGENGHLFDILVADETVKKELEFLFHKMLRMDRKLWNMAFNLFLFGDMFLEIVIDVDDPKGGIVKIVPLPPDSMFRIETTKGKLLEFQQSKEGPDYQSLARVEITQATEQDLAQATALRFAPEQIIHGRIGDDRKTFYPYGVSMVEAARGPAHQLRLMEDAMLVYRLSRAPERRVFYIDVKQLPPSKAEAFIERMKDQFRKKKMYNAHTNSTQGASPVEERWHAPAVDEDYWLPVQANSNTRIETLPGATNLDQNSDVEYFRKKLLIALKVPYSYIAQEDPQITKVTLSSMDVRFARLIERLQLSLSDMLLELSERHLRLRGFPQEMYEDLDIMMTHPSEWREISRQEVLNNRYQYASTIKSANFMSNYDIFVDILKVPEHQAKEYVARAKMQSIEDAKIQVMAANPELIGVGQPGQGDNELGSQAGGPNPMLGGPEAPPGTSPEAPPAQTPPGLSSTGLEDPEQGHPKSAETMDLPDPSEHDIKKYDLEIKDYSKEKDIEEVDPTDTV